MNVCHLISTHAPLARCDKDLKTMYFNEDISTHAPLARCDPLTAIDEWQGINFNSRTSCEVRHKQIFLDFGRGNFNSRTSCEVRRYNVDIFFIFRISTHAPLARCDSKNRRFFAICLHLQSRSGPCLTNTSILYTNFMYKSNKRYVANLSAF